MPDFNNAPKSISSGAQRTALPKLDFRGLLLRGGERRDGREGRGEEGGEGALDLSASSF